MKDLKNILAGNRKYYRPIPFWSWNDKLDPGELKKQIHWMHKNGIGGFFMHARGGLKTKYLSEEWMECIDACCDEAKHLGMEAWVYDENGWPSGFCGGKLLENPNYRDQYILYSFGPADKNADITYLLEGKKLKRIVSSCNVMDKCLNLYIKSSASTVDILNPEVVDAFLTNTHCKYKEKFGEDFANKIRGFFTDEPQYYRWNTPFSPMLVSYFRDKYKVDIYEQLGLLFTEKEGYRTFRYRYWCAMQTLMLKNFAQKIYDWCTNEGVMLTGHYIEETSMGYQLMCCAGVMPFYEYQHIPGIDWLYSITDNELSPRQLGSVARQLGKEHTLTESFAACGWNASPAILKRVAGFQYANGVNMVCHHLMPYSERGQRKRDYPSHFTPLNPWIFEHFKDFNEYLTNLGFLLSKSNESVNVAILHPMRSSYFDYKRDIDGFGIESLDTNLKKTCRLFSSRGIAYHFLDETLMERHGFVKDTHIGCGECEYEYLVLPKILTMGKQTEVYVRQFVKNGGKVLLLDETPKYLEGELYEYDYLYSNCTLEEIESVQPFSVSNLDTELYCTYRMLEENSFLFVQNASHDSSYTQTFQFADKHSFLALDPVSMSTKHLPLTITLHEDESILLFPIEDAPPVERDISEVTCVFSNAKVDFSQNYLTVDTVRYSKDGICFSDPIIIYELFDRLLKEQYKGKLWLRYDFNVQTIPQEISIIAEQTNILAYSINGHSFTFNHNWKDDENFKMADITCHIQQGMNQYEVVLDWSQSEDTYYALFGENVTESLQNCISYDSEIEAIYLCGKFGVYSKSGFEIYDNATVCAHDFYIGDVPKIIDEPITDGLTFFSGNLTLEQEFMFDTEHVILHLPGDYLTAKLWINDNYVGELLFEKRIDISDYARRGTNQIKVEFTIGNRNLLGPFHSTYPEGFAGPIHFEDITFARSTDGQYRYRVCPFYETNGNKRKKYV